MTAHHFSGRVINVVYSNEDFRILKVDLDGSDVQAPASVKGSFRAQNVSVGSWLSFEGRWTNDPKYGRQITVVRSPVSVPQWDTPRALSALSGNGVGPSDRNKLRNHFGNDLVAALEAGEEALKHAGLSEFSAVFVASRWRNLRLHLDTMRFLTDVGIPNHRIGKVWALFDRDSQRSISEDPWVLVRVEGITFEQADTVARRLGTQIEGNPHRTRGAILAALQGCRSEGHLYLDLPDIIDHVRRHDTDTDMEGILRILDETAEAELITIDRETVPGSTLVYEPAVHQMCVDVVEQLHSRREAPPPRGLSDRLLSALGNPVEGDPDLDTVVDAVVEEWSKTSPFALTEHQLGAVRGAFVNPVSILTGLPGTGKTTTLKAVVSILRDAGIRFLLCAPTGIAAKRMSALAKAPASTIHRAFGAEGMTFADDRQVTYAGIVGESGGGPSKNDHAAQWKYNRSSPHPADVVIVDETSMVDLHLLFRILDGTAPSTRIMFVGDPDQLPSVGAGDVLRDLIRSGRFPCTMLTEIFRQEDTSGIVPAAHAIHEGRVPESDGRDFLIIPERTDADAADRVVAFAESLYRRGQNFQVLSPRHGGDIGVTSLNERIRAALNPSAPGLSEMRIGRNTLREGDRVMVTRNDYELSIYNGDIGKIKGISRTSKEVAVKIFNPGGIPREVRIPFKNVGRILRLAYAQTVHKAQGSEYDIIVIPMVPSLGRQLQRNLFYTAITRAKRKVLIVGYASAVARAVVNDRVDRRNSNIVQMLSWGGRTSETGVETPTNGGSDE
jgi:exodeoxyribonuclease V alpha subunit